MARKRNEILKSIEQGVQHPEVIIERSNTALGMPPRTHKQMRQTRLVVLAQAEVAARQNRRKK